MKGNEHVEEVPPPVLARIDELRKMDDFAKGVRAFHSEKHSRIHMRHVERPSHAFHQTRPSNGCFLGVLAVVQGPEAIATCAGHRVARDGVSTARPLASLAG